MKKILETWSLRLLALVFLLLIWQLAVFSSAKSLFPAPLGVLRETWSLLLSADFFYNLGHTLSRVVIGFLLSFFTSLVVGLLMGKNQKLEDFLGVFVFACLMIPALVFSFISVILFGAKELAPLATIFLITTPQLVLLITAGLKNFNQAFFEVGEVFGANLRSKFFDIVFPQLAPSLFAAARTGISIAWKMAIIAEAFALNNGIGYKIYYNFEIFSLKGVLAWTLAFVLVMTVLEYGIINPLEERVFKYKN